MFVFISAVVTKLQRFLMICPKPIFPMSSGLFSTLLCRKQHFPGTHAGQMGAQGRQIRGCWKRIRDGVMGTQADLDTVGSIRLN